jgi:hypothetical protein
MASWGHVGFGQRIASLATTFQMNLLDWGDENFDVAYRHQDINWTSGNLEGGRDGMGGTAAMTRTWVVSGGAAAALVIVGIVGEDRLKGSDARDTMCGLDGDDVLLG